jgi:mono/diheme cytochrome c family protein
LGAKGFARIVAASIVVLTGVSAAHAASGPRVAVIVRPAFDPAQYANQGAVGLLVPGTGTTVTRRGALAALVRGKVRSALLGGVPSGPPLIQLAHSPGPVTIYVALPPPGKSHNVHRYPIAIVGGGYHGLLTSTSTRIGGIVSLADVAPTAVALAQGKSPPIRSRADADAAAHLRRLNARIHHVHDLRTWAMLILIFGTVLLLPMGGAAVLAPLASLSAALVLSAAGATNEALVLTVLAAATVLVPLPLARIAPWAIVGFLVAFLVVLAVWPEMNALAVIGPHPDGGGRYFGVTNMVETLLLAPALVAAAELGVFPVALLTLLIMAWSRAGADGGGLVVFVTAFVVLELRQRRVAFTPLRIAAAVAAAVGLMAALIGLDLLVGGSDHVTRAVRRGPGALFGDWGHRIHVSWAGATSTWYTALICAVFLCVLVGFALRRPRRPTVDAFLVGIAVSLLVNDTPADVLGFGALGCATLIAWERVRRPGAGPSSRLAAVRRSALLLLPLLGLAALAAGCGSGTTVSPTAQTVVGKLATVATAATGDPTAGKVVFTAQGCGGCHTFTAAGTSGTVGPDLNKLADYAKTANQGTEAEFVSKSITDPGAYVQSGYPNGVMPTSYTSLSPQQLADLTAFLTSSK